MVIQAANFKPMTLAPVTKLPRLDYVADGQIMLIRSIRSDRYLDIFGEKFQVSKDLIYLYVKAMVVTEIHALQGYSGDELAQIFDYDIPVWVIDVVTQFAFGME